MERKIRFKNTTKKKYDGKISLSEDKIFLIDPSGNVTESSFNEVIEESEKRQRVRKQKTLQEIQDEERQSQYR